VLFNVVLLDAGGRIRLEVFFQLGPKGGIRQVQFALSSRTRENTWLVTDNVNLPSGGRTPPFWQLRRHRFASLRSLLRRHRRRLRQPGTVCEVWDASQFPEALNREQDRLGEENCRCGFLQKSSDGQRYILSDAGRYRLWLSILSMRYLGIA